MSQTKGKSFGTAPVFFTAISTILGAILFLRFGFAVGTLGFAGALLILLIGHLVTIPTAFAISEIATNQRVEGGGEYFIISRSFGLNIGGTIGIALYLSQAISVAFYVIAFTEAFEPVFNWFQNTYDFSLPRQVISIPAMALLAILILRKGANMGVKALYFVVAILFVSIFLFFIGKTEYAAETTERFAYSPLRNMDNFFFIFAIIFPAFTGMTAGVGLSGDLKNPGRSIPLGTVAGTFVGIIVYIFIVFKLNNSASPDDLINNQLVMSDIAMYGKWIIPLGLAASTISSALGSIMVAPRTLQALGHDKTFPFQRFNRQMAKGKAETNEPFNASVITILIAFVFVFIGDVNAVAKVISIFFMLTYGSLCLISFLNHFGSSPSYRPTFRSHWILSLIGFVFSIFIMFKMDSLYAILAIGIMITLYIYISYYHSERQGLESIFRSALFQVNRNLQVYLQKNQSIKKKASWHPSAVCVTEVNSDRDNAFKLLTWISDKYGFGTYIQYIQGYYSRAAHDQAQEALELLIERAESRDSNVYVDTIVSPSYTSAIAQIIQLPGISGLDNNLALFEYDKKDPVNLEQIVENYPLVRSGNYDVCILGGSNRGVNFHEGIHIWVRRVDYENLNLMVLLSYIIMGHSDWKGAKIKIFNVRRPGQMDEATNQLMELVKTGRLPISLKNVEFVVTDDSVSLKTLINEKSAKAGLTMIGFRSEQIKHEGEKLFEGYSEIGDVLFVNAFRNKEIN
ncbi:MAG: amino acid permease [Bacteroidales bacterium]|jgi:amino acid transporter|nr:amino acid permease [Bacteroidales bacterium]